MEQEKKSNFKWNEVGRGKERGENGQSIGGLTRGVQEGKRNIWRKSRIGERRDLRGQQEFVRTMQEIHTVDFKLPWVSLPPHFDSK